MDDRKALMLAWLEGEGERQRRPVLPLPHAKDSAIRGWVQVGVCGLGGALVTALLVCWLATGRKQADRITCSEGLRQEFFLRAAGDPNPPKLPSARSKGEGTAAWINGVVFGMFLCVMVVFAVAFGIVIGAVFLRAACGFYNELAGGKASPSSVPEPQFGKAMGIIFATTLVNVIAGFMIGLRFGTGEAGARGQAVIPRLLFLPISLLVIAVMSCALLPTTFVRGLLVAFCYLLVVFLVIVVLGGLASVGSLPR